MVSKIIGKTKSRFAEIDTLLASDSTFLFFRCALGPKYPVVLIMFLSYTGLGSSYPLNWSPEILGICCWLMNKIVIQYTCKLWEIPV